MKSPIYPLGVILLPLVIPSVATAAENAKAMIKQAESAAPHEIASKATIMGRDGSVLRKGSNGWTCMPNTMPDDNSPMCNDGVWMKMFDAVGKKADFKTDKVGISYMLQGDSKGGGVSNSDPFHPDPQKASDYVEAGPHLMLILPDKSMLKALPDNPSSGGPWVMWKDTPYAHVMVPVETADNAKTSP